MDLQYNAKMVGILGRKGKSYQEFMIDNTEPTIPQKLSWSLSLSRITRIPSTYSLDFVIQF